eukprot:tig00000219_g19516.t1
MQAFAQETELSQGRVLEKLDHMEKMMNETKGEIKGEIKGKLNEAKGEIKGELTETKRELSSDIKSLDTKIWAIISIAFSA